jgi:ABC-type polysaccharide/polyol phosphate transport system ATPase subunit
MHVIEVAGLCKTFRIPQERHTTLTERVLHLFRPVAFEPLRALDGVDLAIEHGSFVGIIGRNGSGKSTLLKVMAGLLVPDAGEVRIDGSVVALLELGLGFSAELTVDENVSLYAAVLGFARRDAKARGDAAVAFAGLERFRGTKLKNLSTGMRMRLGFATALQAESDILLLDEILAVGDAEFQEKCLGVFADFKRRRKTVVLVTHDLAAVRRLCDCTVLLDDGRVIATGDPDKVIARYLELVAQPELPAAVVDGQVDRWGDGRVRLLAGWLEDEQGRTAEAVVSGSRPTLVLEAEASEETREPVFGMILQEDGAAIVYVMNTLQLAISTGTLAPGQRVEVRIPFVAALRNGRYVIHPAVADRSGTVFHDWRNHFVRFDVTGSRCREGAADLQAGFAWRPLPAGGTETGRRVAGAGVR